MPSKSTYSIRKPQREFLWNRFDVIKVFRQSSAFWPADSLWAGLQGQRRFGWRKLHLMDDQSGNSLYHHRSLVDTTMRMKTIFEAHLKNRLLPNQKNESRIRCKILNHFTRLGLPKYD